MGVEIDQLEKQKTWDIVDLPPNRKAVKTRWMYKIKTDQDNQIIKYKARWVVKGFTQQYGNGLATQTRQCTDLLPKSKSKSKHQNTPLLHHHHVLYHPQIAIT